MITRVGALEILNEYIRSESLKKHCLAVAAAMEAYAEKFSVEGRNDPTINTLTNNSRDAWWICGVLHDFDWEIHPTLEAHPIEGVKILRTKGVDEDILTAILGHNDYTKVPRESLMAKTLFAVDELSGLVVAIAKVKDGFEKIDPDSIRNAMKKKGFAAAINREEIKKGIEELGVEETLHFELVIRALSKVKKELGFG